MRGERIALAPTARGEGFRPLVHDAADNILMLVRERATRAVGNSDDPLADRIEVARLGLGLAQPVQRVGDVEAVELAVRTLAARLDRQESRHRGGDCNRVARVVEHDESRRAETGADRGHAFP